MNFGTGVVLIALLVVVGCIVFSLRKKRSCGCGCSSCPSSEICHKDK